MNKALAGAALAGALLLIFFGVRAEAATIYQTQSSDSLTTFRINVNTSLVNLNAALGASTTTVNNWSALQLFSVASTSQLSVFQKAYFGGTATSSFDSAGALTLNNLSAYQLVATDANKKLVSTSSISTSFLTANTISGVLLGSNLNSHTHDSTLTGTSYNGSASVSDWGLNLSNTNTWSALQKFANASSSIFSAYKAYFGGTATSTFDIAGKLTLVNAANALNIPALGTAAGAFLAVDPSGNVIATTTPNSSAATDPFTHPSTDVSATSSGLMISASSTIGAGGNTTGLTISGGATTTRTAYVAGNTILAASGGTVTLGSTAGFTSLVLYGQDGPPAHKATITTNALGGSDKTFTLPNTTGTFCLTITCAGTTTANTWTGLQSFSSASTTQLSVFQKAYFGGTATTTIDVNGLLTFINATSSGALGATNIFSSLASSTDVRVSSLGSAAGTFVAADPTGKLIATTSPSAGGSGTVGSGTTGQFPYYGGAGTTLTATSSIFLDTTGFVGIGTTTPFKPFTVEATSSNGVAAFIRKTGALSGATLTSINLALRTTDATLPASQGISLDFFIATGTPSSENPNLGSKFGIIAAVRTTDDRSGAFWILPSKNNTTGTQYIWLDANGYFNVGTTSAAAAGFNFQNLGNIANAARFTSNVGAPLFTLSNTGIFTGIYGSTTALTASGSLYADTASSTNLTVSGVRSALHLAGADGTVSAYSGASCTNQFVRSLNGAGVATCATVANTDLTNSTISGVALGGTLNALTATNGTLTFSGSYDGSAARTVGLNLGNANTWTALQQFGNSSSTILSAYTAYFGGNATSTIDINGKIIFTNASSTGAIGAATGYFALASTTDVRVSSLGNAAGTFVAADPTGKLIATTTPPGSGSASTTLLTDQNTWAAKQTFATASSTYFSALSGLWTPVTSAVLLADANKLVGAASAQTCTNQFVRAMSAAYVATCAAVSLTADVTGVLPIANGGTNNSAFTKTMGVAFFNGTLVDSTSTAMFDTLGRFGLASSTPKYGFSIGTTTVHSAGQLALNYGSSTTATSPITVSWESGNTQRFIVTGTTQFIINATSSQPIDGGKYILKICQDPTGGRAVSFTTPGQLRWANGTTSVGTTANTCSMLGMIYDGTYAHYDIVASSTGLLIK